MVGVYYTTKYIFDLKENDVYWCTADPGWITGHSYVVYGPLSVGGTILISENTPDYPDPGIWWKMVEEYGVSILYTAPTAIRMFMKLGREWPDKYNLSSLAHPRIGRRTAEPGGLRMVLPCDRQETSARSLIPGGRPRPVCT